MGEAIANGPDEVPPRLIAGWLGGGCRARRCFAGSSVSARSFDGGPLFAAAVRIGPEELLVTGGYSLIGPVTNAAWIIQL